MGSSYSYWYEIGRCVPQGLILGPLLFNILILFLFIDKTNIYNSADDNTIYSCNNNLQTILKNLKNDMINASKWFKVNSMKVNSVNSNPTKFQFMIPGKNTRQTSEISFRANNFIRNNITRSLNILK